MTIKERLVSLGISEEQAQKVADNFGKVIDGIYITKDRFNEVNNELKSSKETIKERDKQIENIKNSSEDVETLKSTIQSLQNENKEATIKAEQALQIERKTNAVKMQLNGKVHNIDIALSQFKLEDILMNDDGTVKSGLNEQIETLRKNNDFLFIAEKTPDNQGGSVKGATPRTGVVGENGNKLSQEEEFAKKIANSAKENANNKATQYYFGK